MDKIKLTGRLTDTPDFSYTTNGGTAVVNFGLAVDRSYTDQNGTRIKRTVFYRITAWRKLAEIINQWKDKGDLVLVEGQLTANFEQNHNGELTCNGGRVWEDQNGNWRNSFEVTADKVEFLANGPNNQKTGQASQASAPQPVDDDDVPF